MRSKIILVLLLNLSFNILLSESVEDNDFPEYNKCLENRIDVILSQFFENQAAKGAQGPACTLAHAGALNEAYDAKNLMREYLAHMNRYLRLEFPIDHKPLTCTKLFQLLKRINIKYTSAPDKVSFQAVESYLNYRLSKINC